jgi:hypothetical protein
VTADPIGDPGDDPLWDEEFDPYTSPPDGPDAFLNGLPAELREKYLVDPWTGDGEKMAAGFLHHAVGRPGVGFAAGGVLDRLEPGPVLAGFLADAADASQAGASPGAAGGRPAGASDAGAADASAGSPASAGSLGGAPAGGPDGAPADTAGAGGGGGLAGLGESELVGVLCAARRMASWAAAQEVEAVITLARRRAVQARERKNPHLLEHVSDELAAALTLTGRGGRRLEDLAGSLARLDATRAALAAGLIDWPRAALIADELAVLSDADARRVEAKVLPAAPGLTTSQLRSALRRAILAVDPAAATRRRKAARQDARVELWDEPSGNSALAARELPPAEAIAADARLTAQARWLQARGTPGTLQQLRAAVLSATLNGRPLASLLPAGTNPDGPHPGAPDPSALDPGAPGAGAPDADVADPGTDGSNAAGRDAANSDADDPGSDGASGTGVGPAGQPVPPSAGPPDNPGSSADPGITGTVNLTMPFSAWAGLSEAPGEVPGYGPADASTCRDLAAWLAAWPATRWCLTLTDPDGHAVAHACARDSPGPPTPRLAAGWLGTLRPVRLEAGDCTHQRQAPGYRPPRSLRHLIEIRQRTCTFPGCRRPATRTDLDHTIPYDQGGRTCQCNLAPLCRRHHQAKQAPGWRLEQPEPGIMTWTLPHRRTYTTQPDPYPT